MDGQELVAWLALGVGAVSLGWQVLDARRRRATDVELQIQHAALPASIPDGPELLGIPSIGNDDQNVIWPAPDDRLTYVTVVAAVNRGESPEWMHDMRVCDRRRTLGSGANPGGPPLELPARGRKAWAFRVDGAIFDLARWLLRRPGSRFQDHPFGTPLP